MEQLPATFSPRKNKSNRYCCVPQCTSKANRDMTVRFHEFPKDGEFITVETSWGDKEKCDRRKLWTHRLKIGKSITKSMVVCSKHFLRSDYILPEIPAKQRNLKKTAVPSLNLPKSSTDDQLKEHMKKTHDERSARHRNYQQLAQDCTVPNSRQMNSEGTGETNEVDRYRDGEGTWETMELNPDRDAAEDLISLGNSLPVIEKHSIEVQATPERRDFGCQVSSGDFTKSFSDFIQSPKTLTTFTGIDTFLKLSCIVNILSLLQPDSNRCTFSNKEKVIMTMMKLKLNWPFTVLAVLFGCTATTCKNIISSTITILASFLKSTVVWPSKEEILCNMPKCFDKFKRVRVVLDCTEIRVSTFKCLKCRILSYSQYKGSHTVKYLIGATPGGLISFISAGYGGRASDRKINSNQLQLESQLLDLLEPFIDEIMVDKGFLIQSLCEENGIRVIHPPFLRKKTI